MQHLKVKTSKSFAICSRSFFPLILPPGAHETFACFYSRALLQHLQDSLNSGFAGNKQDILASAKKTNKKIDDSTRSILQYKQSCQRQLNGKLEGIEQKLKELANAIIAQQEGVPGSISFTGGTERRSSTTTATSVAAVSTATAGTTQKDMIFIKEQIRELQILLRHEREAKKKLEKEILALEKDHKEKMDAVLGPCTKQDKTDATAPTPTKPITRRGKEANAAWEKKEAEGRLTRRRSSRTTRKL